MNPASVRMHARPEAKIPAPQGGGLIRPRLLHALDGALSTRLSILFAARGWGKTTLLSQWAASAGGDADVVWISWDDDGMAGRSLASTVASQIEKHERDTDRQLIVLVDDLVGIDADHDLEKVLLAAPEWFHLVLSTRSNPRMNLTRSEFSDSIRLDAADLGFRLDEIGRLFRKIYGYPLDLKDLARLSVDSGGWPAALSLFAHATRRDSAVKRSARLAASDPTPYADYLENEILRGVPSRLTEFLRECCGLDSLTTDRCRELTSAPSASILLQEAHSLGLVEQDRLGDALRISTLLSRHLMLGEGVVDAQLRMHRTASLLERRGDVGEAVALSAACGDWPQVLRLLGTYGVDAVPIGGCAWTELAPPSLSEDPAFLLARGRYLADDGRLARAESLFDRVIELEPDAAVAEAARVLRSRRAIDAHSSLSDLLRGNLAAALPALRERASAGRLDVADRMLAQLALVVLTGGTGSERVLSDLDDIHRDALRSGLPWLARVARGALAEFSGAAESARVRESLVETCDRRGDDWGAVAILAIACLVRLRKGETDTDQLDPLADRCRRLGAGFIEVWARAACALVDVLARREDAALTARSAATFAQRADAPGALSIAYGALSLDPAQSPAIRAEFYGLARQTARDAGLVGRPWTWFGQGRADETTLAVLPLQVRDASGAHVTVRCFGGFSFSINGVPLDLATVRPQARTVFRMLALHAGNPVHRDLLASVLWGELGTTSALHSLHVSMSALRSALNSGSAGSAERLLIRRGEAYALDISSTSTSDLMGFDRAMGDASSARSHQDAEGTAAALRRSVQLYTSDIFPEDGAAEWVVGARERYRLRAAEAACSLAQLELRLGNRDAAVAAGERSIEIDPWRDESWRTVIDVHYRAGDPVAAARAKRNYARLMESLELPV